jgi:hypothetical protein
MERPEPDAVQRLLADLGHLETLTTAARRPCASERVIAELGQAQARLLYDAMASADGAGLGLDLATGSLAA